MSNRTRQPSVVQVIEERMECKPIHSDAARHIAEKIRQSTWGGAADFNVITLFERKKVWVMLDLETAEAFAKEVDLGTNHGTEGKDNA